ncbi:hypothetical protein QJS10_CPA03g00281 [Acorus calamus]|uniref:Late embryogenesis abundant protein LEA-2 subgroup domain-containing protein n=1 Tax=Acorus calamus TaxID=4465 RepID=A0AAV9F9F3_ACOCL|nr:hypothetical protein QJS10_CPA03g00281 [Acorus calamus]
MMGDKKEQVRPLAISPTHELENPFSSSSSPSSKFKLHYRRRRHCILCCGCATATAAIVAVVLLVLALTVFKVKEPNITMNSLTLQNFQVALATPVTINLTVTADVSVKNPNAASFNFGNTTTSISYRGTTMGEVHGPPGEAPAHRTVRMNLTVDVLGDKLIGVPSLLGDVASGSLAVGSLTRVGGRVKIIGIIKRHVVVTMNCSFTVSVTTQSILDQRCVQHVKL